MGKNKKMKKNTNFDITKIKKCIEANSTSEDAEKFNEINQAIFGANINMRRHINDIKDGLKPIHRRILYTMYKKGIKPGKIEKSTSIVGDVLKIHPHGDSSAYEAMVFLGQRWRNNVALVQSSGNFGNAYNSQDYGHSRYTYASLSEFAWDCFFSEWKPNEDNRVVDWMESFDESTYEPMYLPAKYPLFLIQWHRGMGVGRYTSTCGFNIDEAFEGMIELIKDPKAKFELYPDDPRGCTIINKSELKGLIDKDITDPKVSVTVKVRSTYEINHHKGTDVISIENVPYEVSPATVEDRISELCKAGKLPEILDINHRLRNFEDDFSIDIRVRRGYDPHALMNKLYTMTDLQMSYPLVYAFVDGLQSKDYTIRQAMLEWLDYRRETVRRLNACRLVVVLKRLHFLNPLITILKSGKIDEFIKTIRKSNDDKEKLIEKIMKLFDFTDYQAETISNVRISDLSISKLHQYEEERDKLTKESMELDNIIRHPKEIDKIIIKQLRDGIDKYGHSRKSKLSNVLNRKYVPDTNHHLVFTSKYVKKLPADEYQVKIGRIDNGEKVMKQIRINNKDFIYIFDSEGKVNRLQVNDIGNSSSQMMGISLSNIGVNGNFVGLIPISEKESLPMYTVTVTENGAITKTLTAEMDEKSKKFTFMKLNKGDKVSGVCTCENEDKIIVFTNKGNAVIFPFADFTTTSLNTKGVQALKLSDGEYVIGVERIRHKDSHLITLTNRGYMKCFPIKQMPKTKRNAEPIEIVDGDGQLIKVISTNIDDDRIANIYTTAGLFEIDPINIKCKRRIGKSQRVVELKATEYAFDIEI